MSEQSNEVVDPDTGEAITTGEMAARAIAKAMARAIFKTDAIDDERVVAIRTSCGNLYEVHVSELADEMLQSLLRQNTDGNPSYLAAVRNELQRRSAEGTA